MVSTCYARSGPSPWADERPTTLADSVGGGPALRVESPGFSTLLRVRGHSAGDVGPVPSGWADWASALAAHRLMGNPPDVSLLENTGGSLRVRALEDLVVAVTGAEASLSIESGGLDGAREAAGAVRLAPSWRPFALRQGERLVVGTVQRGLRVMLSVRGGLTPCGTERDDSIVCIPVSRGWELAVGEAPRSAVATHEVPVPLPEPAGEVTTVPLPLDPRDTCLGVDQCRSPQGPPADAHRPLEGRSLLLDRTWRVSEEGDHISVRLAPEGDGAVSSADAFRESVAASSGLAAGTVQFLSNGELRVLLSDLPSPSQYPMSIDSDEVPTRRDYVFAGTDPLPEDHVVVFARFDAATTQLLAQSAPGVRIRFDPEA